MSLRKLNSDAEAIAERTINAARLTINGDGRIDDSELSVTRAEAAEIDLLCYFLGAARNACINFATKYLCSIIDETTLDVKLPKGAKATRKNSIQRIPFKLNPEVHSGLRQVMESGKVDRSMTEIDLVKASVLLFNKKLLPPKTKRKNADG